MTGRLRILGKRLVRTRRAPVLRLRLRCYGADCVGRLEVTVLRPGAPRRAASAAGRRARRFRIPRGATRVMRLRLPERSARMLRRRGRIRVLAQAELEAAGVARRSFVVRRPGSS